MADFRQDFNRGLTVTESQTGLTPVEIYTQFHRITGRLAKGNVRTSDIFNQVERHFLTVEKASVSALAGGKAPVEVDEIQLNTRVILLVVPRESRAPMPMSGGSRNQMLRVEKQRHRAIVECPPFTVTGNIHLVQETKLRDALLTISTQFIPLTDASISIAGLASPPITVETAIVNRSFIHMLYAAGTPAVSNPVPPASTAPTPPSSTPPSRLLIRRTS